MSDFLSSMAASSLLRADRVRTSLGVSELESRARSATPARPLQLSASGFDLIAEAKLASPSEGRIAPADDSDRTLRSIAIDLASSGAAALSVLTEPLAFDGDIRHLMAMAVEVDVPVIRKDFLVDPIQVLEARAAGASGVLLIARLVDSGRLIEMTDLAISLGMFVLVEVFTEPEIDVAAAVFDRQVLIGVNSRDLETLRIDIGRHRALIPHLPTHLPAVAESGMTTPKQVAEVAALGYQLALAGSALVREANPGITATQFLEAGRRHVGART